MESLKVMHAAIARAVAMKTKSAPSSPVALLSYVIPSARLGWQEGPHQMQPLGLGLPNLHSHEPNKLLLHINSPVCDALLEQH